MEKLIKECEAEEAELKLSEFEAGNRGSPCQLGPVDGCEIRFSHHEMRPWLRPKRLLVWESNHSRVSEVVQDLLHRKYEPYEPPPPRHEPPEMPGPCLVLRACLSPSSRVPVLFCFRV